MQSFSQSFRANNIGIINAVVVFLFKNLILIFNCIV